MSFISFKFTAWKFFSPVWFCVLALLPFGEAGGASKFSLLTPAIVVLPANLQVALTKTQQPRYMTTVRKIINDPVYGFITIDDELIYEVISHPYFQRLRRISQMAMANLVYPGAVHSRLHHALGAYHLMGNAITELKNKGI